MTTTDIATIAPAIGGMDAGRRGEHEQARTLAGLNHTETEFPSQKCVHHFFEEQARRTPDATAIVFAKNRLKFRELDEQANGLARKLRELGIKADVPVGICVERSLAMVVGLLGILKAGGCYVPLDPHYPRERLAFVLADAQPAVLITQRSLRDAIKLASPKVKVVCLDEPVHSTQSESHDVGGTRQDSASLAYIIYTSGSTGRPKGVMVTHRNVANFFTGMDHVLDAQEGVWLAVTSISFDISVLELFWTLARGFTVVIASEGAPPATLQKFNETATPQLDQTGEGVGILDQMLEHGVTHLQCTPSLAGSLVRAPGSWDVLRQLRQLLIGGEVLPVALSVQLRQHLTGDLFNMYGPTETTVWSATHRVGEVSGSVPIGRPIANTLIHVLDDQLKPIPGGEVGELYIGGEGVARGYWKRPELTAERFVSDPFSPDPDARLYRTGDMGRYRSDGTLEFLGRADHQVKLHGHRIELGEIEWALSQHPAVQECVVHVWKAGPEDRRLAAYLVSTSSGLKKTDSGASSSPQPAPASLRSKARLDEARGELSPVIYEPLTRQVRESADLGSPSLRRFLEARLPRYMIPAAFVWLEKMPLTPNGKVDRNALPQPNPSRSNDEVLYAAPGPGIEQRIAEIWCETLQVEKVGVNDNFFDLGGNSLLLMQIHSRLCEALKEDLPIVRFFEHPTIAALTSFLASDDRSALHTIHQRATRQREAFTRRQRPVPIT